MQKTLLAAAICQVLVSNFSGTSYTIGSCRVLSAREHESDEPQSFLLPEPEAQAMVDYLLNENPHIQVEIRPFLPEPGSDSEDADNTDAELTDAAQTASSLTEDVVTDPVDVIPADTATEQQTDAGTELTGEQQPASGTDTGATEQQPAATEGATDTATEQKTDAAQEPAPKAGRQKAQKQ